MRIIFILELVLALALGLAIERISFHRLLEFGDFPFHPKSIQYGVYFIEYSNPFCLGVVLVEGSALLVELIRRRSPRISGIRPHDLVDLLHHCGDPLF